MELFTVVKRFIVLASLVDLNKKISALRIRSYKLEQGILKGEVSPYH